MSTRCKRRRVSRTVKEEKDVLVADDAPFKSDGVVIGDECLGKDAIRSFYDHLRSSWSFEDEHPTGTDIVKSLPVSILCSLLGTKYCTRDLLQLNSRSLCLEKVSERVLRDLEDGVDWKRVIFHGLELLQRMGLLRFAARPSHKKGRFYLTNTWGRVELTRSLSIGDQSLSLEKKRTVDEVFDKMREEEGLAIGKGYRKRKVVDAIGRKKSSGDIYPVEIPPQELEGILNIFRMRKAMKVLLSRVDHVTPLDEKNLIPESCPVLLKLLGFSQSSILSLLEEQVKEKGWDERESLPQWVSGEDLLAIWSYYEVLKARAARTNPFVDSGIPESRLRIGEGWLDGKVPRRSGKEVLSRIRYLIRLTARRSSQSQEKRRSIEEGGSVFSFPLQHVYASIQKQQEQLQKRESDAKRPFVPVFVPPRHESPSFRRFLLDSIPGDDGECNNGDHSLRVPLLPVTSQLHRLSGISMSGATSTVSERDGMIFARLRTFFWDPVRCDDEFGQLLSPFGREEVDRCCEELIGSGVLKRRKRGGRGKLNIPGDVCSDLTILERESDPVPDLELFSRVMKGEMVLEPEPPPLVFARHVKAAGSVLAEAVKGEECLLEDLFPDKCFFRQGGRVVESEDQELVELIRSLIPKSFEGISVNSVVRSLSVNLEDVARVSPSFLVVNGYREEFLVSPEFANDWKVTDSLHTRSGKRNETVWNAVCADIKGVVGEVPGIEERELCAVVSVVNPADVMVCITEMVKNDELAVIAQSPRRYAKLFTE